MALKVSHRLILGFGVLLLLLLGSSLYAYRVVDTLNFKIGDIVHDKTAKIELEYKLITQSQEMRVQYRQIILEDEQAGREKVRDKYLAAKQKFAEYEEQLKALLVDTTYPTDPEEMDAYKVVEDVKAQAFPAADETIRLALSGDIAAAKAQVGASSSPMMSKLNQALADLAAVQEKLNQAKSKDTETLATESLMIIIGLDILAMVVGVVLGWLILRSVSKPLQGLQEFLVRLAQDFDFTRRLPVIRDDEIGLSVRAVNGLLDAMQGSVRQLHQVGNSVGSSVSKLADTSHEMSQAASGVSSSASAMAAGIEQVTVSINHVADRAQECDSTAREAGKLAASGGSVIEATIRGINQIAGQVRQSATQIESLKDRTASINAVVNVIKDIADQTNLLALNAAIEAARAGELGRGFAVVADEVRKLAERTSSSTHEIISTVTAIQQEAGSTVQSMQQTVRHVDEGVGLAREADQAIRDIRESADRVVEQVSEISVAMREQSTASSMLAQQVERVAQLAEESSAAANSTADEGGHLRGLAGELDQAVSRYRV